MKSSHYRFEKLTEHVTFARSRPEGGALSNSALIDLGEETLVFDTSLTPQAAEDLRRVAAEATGRAPTLAANSHWHLDHVLGNQVFSDIATYGTRRTREILVEKHDELMAEVSPDSMQKGVLDIEELVKAASSTAAREYLESVLDTNRWLLSAAPTLRLTPPNRTFEERFRLPGRSKAELVTFGSGHTESDALLHLPEEGLVFAGDLVVVETHPNLTSGNPEHWLEVLQEIQRLRPERIVPGHGPVSSGEATESIRDYVATLLSMSGSPGTVDVPSKFAGWSMADQFEENVRFLRSRASRRHPA